ncbi:GtrA family protein [Herbidospora galbida]|uniref:GtrA family protein n=1 Tax=Herbidospora galbida TaxID=2575442 RepID=UPI001484FBDC|nr:GtrA family protein [Herbidospora galbida]
MAIVPDYHLRVVRFLLVGGFCFGVQYLAMTAMASAGVPWTPADAIGFLLSAQLNFVLSSKFTWGDRRFPLTVKRWSSYNGTALLSLAVNTGVFALIHPYLPTLISAAIGVLIGTIVTYLICDKFVFATREKAREKAEALA